MSEGELPVELDKLQIATNPRNAAATDCVFVLKNNPFFIGDGLQLETKDDAFHQKQQQIFQLKQDKAESKLPKTTKCAMSSAKVEDAKSGIRRQHFKKPSNQKRLLRAPILQVLKNCTQIPVMPEFDETTANTDSACNARLHLPHDINDFRDLIETTQTVKLSEINERFNRLQFSANPSSNFAQRQKESSTKKEAQHHSTPNHSRKSNFRSNYSEHRHNNNQHRSSTCSQQAFGTSAADDVTIDELASYFDTFVHIPKKMSTMAEMMYI